MRILMNMINLHPWVEYMENNIYVDDIFDHRDEDDLWFISINVMAYLISKMIKGVLTKYTNKVNIPKDYQHYINMKNEYKNLYSYRGNTISENSFNCWDILYGQSAA